MVLNEDSLQKDEFIVRELNISRWGLIGYYLFAIFLIPTIIFPIILILIAEMIVKGTKYYITNKRIIYDYQFISKKQVSVKYDRVQDLEVNQGLFDRMLGIGTINVNTAGSSGIELKMKDIKNPFEIKKVIEDIMHNGAENDIHTFKCSECGKEVESNAKFCPNCGASFEEENEC